MKLCRCDRGEAHPGTDLCSHCEREARSNEYDGSRTIPYKEKLESQAIELRNKIKAKKERLADLEMKLKRVEYAMTVKV